VVLDVFNVGHCLYGCQSCGIREHNVPVYFSRFYNNQLPYSSSDVRALLDKQKKAPSVLLCPSVGFLSYLFNDLIIEQLVQLSKLEYVFMVKLHGYCYLDNHPLSGNCLSVTNLKTRLVTHRT
jgi:hypothetical protein